jgi:diguanylate cyclase (GGDEF)-like protein
VQLRDTTHFKARFLLPIVAATGMTILALAGFLAWSVQQIDGDALAREQQLLDRAFEELKTQMYIAQAELAVWDDAVAAYEDDDWPWLVENLGVNAFDTFGHNRVYIFDSSLSPVMAIREGGQVAPSTASEYVPDLAPFFERLQSLDGEATIASYNSGVSDTAPQAMEFAMLEGQPALIAVMPILSYSGDYTMPAGTEPLYVSILLLNAELASYLGDQYLIANPTFVLTEPTITASLPVLGQDQLPVAWITWQPETPGARLVGVTLPALLTALAIGIVIVGLLLRSLHTALSQLNAEREDASHRALHDPLTGLGNRGLFHLKLAENFPTGRKSTPSLAVLALDLDKFKQVNDTMGHQAGDELLIRIGAIIQPLLGTHDTLIRLGGDEFAIIQPGIAGHGQPAALAQSIIEALARPISLAAGVARIGVSIGIATAPDLAHDQTELIRFADDALYRAKNGGRNRYCIYGSGETNEPARLDAQLREAFIARRSDSTPVSSQGPA